VLTASQSFAGISAFAVRFLFPTADWLQWLQWLQPTTAPPFVATVAGGRRIKFIF
jgi:hypothetical protein